MAKPSTPKVFISYSWDSEGHKAWVKALAARLRGDGVDVVLDQWHLALGDELPQFMESSVRDSDYVLLICTPAFKKKADGRKGGVGYEGHVITAEVFAGAAQRKFVPLLREGAWQDAAPSWLAGKLFVDLRHDPIEASRYQLLLEHLHDDRDPPPAVLPYSRRKPGQAPGIDASTDDAGSLSQSQPLPSLIPIQARRALSAIESLLACLHGLDDEIRETLLPLTMYDGEWSVEEKNNAIHSLYKLASCERLLSRLRVALSELRAERDKGLELDPEGTSLARGVVDCAQLVLDKFGQSFVTPWPGPQALHQLVNAINQECEMDDDDDQRNYVVWAIGDQAGQLSAAVDRGRLRELDDMCGRFRAWVTPRQT